MLPPGGGTFPRESLGYFGQAVLLWAINGGRLLELHGKLGSHRRPTARSQCIFTLYLLGEQDRIVGVSGYAVRPPQVRREKPRVSAFTSADIPKILALEPDLVLTFSDLQASIAADLIRAGVAVHAFNQRDIAGILAMIRTLGALVGATEKAEAPAQRCAIRWVRRCGELVQEIERGCTLLACAEQQMLRVPIVTARHPVAFPAVHRVQEGGSF